MNNLIPHDIISNLDSYFFALFNQKFHIILKVLFHTDMSSRYLEDKDTVQINNLGFFFR